MSLGITRSKNVVLSPKMEDTLKLPRLLASTGDTYCCSIADSRSRERNLEEDGQAEAEILATVEFDVYSKVEKGSSRDEDALEVNYFKSAQW